MSSSCEERAPSPVLAAPTSPLQLNAFRWRRRGRWNRSRADHDDGKGHEKDDELHDNVGWFAAER